MPSSSRISWFHHPNNSWRRKQIIKPLNTKSFYFPVTSSRWRVNIPKNVLTLRFCSPFLMSNVSLRGLVASCVEDVLLWRGWIHGWESRQVPLTLHIASKARQPAATSTPIKPRHRIAVYASVEKLNYIQDITKLTLTAQVTPPGYQKSKGFWRRLVLRWNTKECQIWDAEDSSHDVVTLCHWVGNSEVPKDPSVCLSTCLHLQAKVGLSSPSG
jgi:hypothetical protein